MYTRPNNRRGRLSLAVTLTLASLCSGAYAADTDPEIIDEGNGWQLMMVTPADDEGLNSLLSEDPAPILTVDSAVGLRESPLPESIKADLEAEFARGDESVSIAVHFDVARAIAEGNEAEQFAEFIVPDDESDGLGSFGAKAIGCSTDWRHRHKILTRDFNGFNYSKNTSSGGFSGNIDVSVPLTGSGEIDIEYAYKKTAFCVPWTAKFVKAQATGHLDVGETLFEAHGSAQYTSSERKVLIKPEAATNFMIGPLPVRVGVEFPIGAGYDLEVQAEADLDLKARATGSLAFDLTCTTSGCAKTSGGTNENTISLDDLLNPSAEGGISLQADLKPYAFVEARAFLYASSIASAGAGVEVSAPTRLFYYYGNQCGNGTGASTAEIVNGGYLDVGAQIQFYWNATLLGDDHFNWFDTPISSIGGYFHEVEVDRFLRGGDAHKALRHTLYFDEFRIGSSGLSPLSPVFTGPASVNMGASGSFTVKKRPCVPMDERLFYTLSWGDNTSSNAQADPGSSATVAHTFNNFGAHTLTARMTTDLGGRSINQTTSRSLNVNANAVPPSPLTVTAPTSDADGAYSVSWSSTVNTSYYKLFRSNNGGSYVLLNSNLTSTSRSLTAQPYGANRYAVQACNNVGCSASKFSGNVQVGVIPAAPSLTVTSMLCRGANDVDWSAPSGATSYKLYASTGTNPSAAGIWYEGTGRSTAINVTSTTNLWVKACGTGGCSGFSSMKTAFVQPGECL